MNPYTVLAQSAGHADERRFYAELGRWHDEMVMHQRVVRRLGRRACSDHCPHVQGQQLWREAVALLGSAADRLTFLRTCAADALRPPHRAESRPKPA